MFRCLFILFLLTMSLFSVYGQGYKNYKILEGHTAEVAFIAMRNEDNLLATGDKKGTILIWDINKGEVLNELKAHQLEITHLEFSQNGNILASASYDGTIKIWDTKTFELKRTINVPKGIAYSDINGNEPTFLALHSTKKLLFFGGYNSKVFQYNLSTSEQLELFEDKSFGITSGILNAKDNWLYFAAGPKIFAYDLLNQKVAHVISVKAQSEEHGYICELAINKDGHIASWLYGGKVNLYQSPNFKLLKTLDATSKLGTSNISFDENGKFLLTGNDGNMTKIWDLTADNIFQVLKDHKKRTTTFTFSSDNKFIATGSDDQRIILWKKEKPIIDISKLPKEVNGRNIDVQTVLETKKQQVQLDFWDNKRVDGDIISVFLNGKELLSKYKLIRRKKTIKFPLEKETNIITIYAHNLGKIPPNTIGVTWVDGKKHTEYTFQSDQEKSATIIIERN